MGKKATIRTRMRRKVARDFGEVSRDAGGNVTMIRLTPYRDNPLAPRAMVSKIGGIYREDTHLIRCTFIDEFPNAQGVPEAIAQAHLIWKTEQNWLETRSEFEWVMREFVEGTFGDGGSRRRQ